MTLAFNRPVPNYLPYTKNRIAIIGDIPGLDDLRENIPFVGSSGRLLRQLCSSVGITPGQCYLGNISQHRPNSNDFQSLDWNGPEIQQGLSTLKTELTAYDPHVIILLGNAALHAAKSCSPPKRRAGKIVWPFQVADWRGTFFVCDDKNSPFYGYKCIASYHPSQCFRMFEWTPILRLDLKKAERSAYTRVFTPPVRNIDLDTTFHHVVSRLENILETKPRITLDIEGGVGTLKCISFAVSPTDVFIVPFTTITGNHYWPTVEQETVIWRLVSSVLGDPLIPKVLQNALYDNFVLSYSYKCPIVNVEDDTMLAHWEQFCEFEKNLGFQASIYTNEPYYKHTIASRDEQTFWAYCCRDSAVSYEIRNTLVQKLEQQPASLKHYRFNTDMLHPILYMELKGIPYNVAKAEKRRAELTVKLNDYLEKLYMISGRPIATSGVGFTKFLYDEMGMPEVRNKKTGALTANYEALLRILKKTNHPVAHLAIRIRALKTRIQMLGISADDDGRIRCGYNVVGAETGRLTCYTSPTGSGYNLQTIPEYDRDLFIPDPGYYFFQCDLSGADGWTVAAHCAALGDSTMLEDYLYGLKPAKLLALGLRRGPQVMSIQDRAELYELSKEIKKEDWAYFACKQGQHGSNYLMGPTTLATRILIESEGKVVVTSAFCEQVQNLYFRRYPGVKKWHSWMGRELAESKKTVSASGHVRQYFGRREDILGSALANEPQENTTYATNLAALNLWFDPENRITKPGTRGVDLRCQPLHQVHDALCGQFRIEDAHWAVPQIKSYFDNEIEIAGIKVRIPFEGRYGTSWGTLEHAI